MGNSLIAVENFCLVPPARYCVLPLIELGWYAVGLKENCQDLLQCTRHIAQQHVRPVNVCLFCITMSGVSGLCITVSRENGRGAQACLDDCGTRSNSGLMVFAFLKSLFSAPDNSASPTARVPEGQRVYAVGDIHGRLDLLEALAAAIEEDHASLTPADATFILLGDLVDRGPASAGVVRFARDWQRRCKVRILAGNHEEMFLKSFENVDILRHFLRHGGKDTLFSYGVTRKEYQVATVEDVQKLMALHVPAEDRAYISGFEDMIEIGDYVFVHAGIDPAVPIDQQKTADLRWIREPFLSHPDSFGPVVVHGHTITDDPVDNGNRVGIDTGAYASGRLTALVLESDQRRYIEACQEEDGAITIRHLQSDARPRHVPSGC